MGVNSLPKTVTGQRRECDLNPCPSAPESSTLTTRLASHGYSRVDLAVGVIVLSPTLLYIGGASAGHVASSSLLDIANELGVYEKVLHVLSVETDKIQQQITASDGSRQQHNATLDTLHGRVSQQRCGLSSSKVGKVSK